MSNQFSLLVYIENVLVEKSSATGIGPTRQIASGATTNRTKVKQVIYLKTDASLHKNAGGCYWTISRSIFDVRNSEIYSLNKIFIADVVEYLSNRFV